MHANALPQVTLNGAETLSNKTLVAPVLGAPTSGDLRNCTGLPDSMIGMGQSLHFGAIVDLFLDDTSRHSDGGAWRKRCQDKSWYKEVSEASAPCTVWLGQASSAAAAWTKTGAVQYACFQATATAGSGGSAVTAGKFYQLTGATSATTTVTEAFRGSKAEYPSRCAWVAEAARVVGYDLDTGAVWKVVLLTANYALHSGTAKCVTALNGAIMVGSTTQSSRLDFIADMAYKRDATNFSFNVLPLGSCNTAGAWQAINATAVLGNASVNAIAMTVLDNSPIDPATGLPIPTVAVATASGISVVQNSGTVINGSYTATRMVFGDGGDLYWARSGDNVVRYSRAVQNQSGTLSTTSMGITTATSANAAGAALLAGNKTNFVWGGASSSGQLTFLKENPTNTVISLVAFVTPTYNTGWQVGDSRGTFLADSVAETLTASGELIVSGDMSSAAGWTVGGSWAFGSGVATNTPGSATNLSQVVATVVGKNYILGFTNTRAAGTLTVQAGGVTVATLTAASTTPTGFTATATTTTISFNAGATFDGTVDNVTVKLASADRSVKNVPLLVIGSIDKAPVATGASTMGYGSSAGTGNAFSVANYMEQPYSANMDFGTGSFAIQFWLKMGANSAIEYVLNRDSAVAGKAIRVRVETTGYLTLELYDGTTTRTATGSVAITDGLWHKWSASYSLGTLNVYRDNVLYATATGAALLTMTNTSAVLRVGCDVAGTLPLIHGALALLRVSATVKSADQAAQIYRDEIPLFQANAQGILYGASSAVSALTYDPVTDTYVAGTTAGTSTFRGLCRVSSTPIATLGGATITALSAMGGSVVSGGSVGSYAYQPSMSLRDELRRKDESRRALGKVPQVFDFDTISFTATPSSGSPTLTASSVVGTPYEGMGITGTGIAAGATLTKIVGSTYTMSANATSSPGAVTIAQSSFDLPKGYTAMRVSAAGTIKRLGASKDYTVANDGYKETVNFGTSPGSAVWVGVMATRST